MLKTLPKRKIRDVIAERLKSHIVSEGLVSGDRLPNETELAEHFGVSRLSLREATKALEFLGIVESRTGVGLTVGHIDMDRVTSHLGFHPALHQADPLPLIESRIVIETGVLPYVAKRMAQDPSIHENLQGIVDRFQSAANCSNGLIWMSNFTARCWTPAGFRPWSPSAICCRCSFSSFATV